MHGHSAAVTPRSPAGTVDLVRAWQLLTLEFCNFPPEIQANGDDFAV
jgi:hypothetical protein